MENNIRIEIEGGLALIYAPYHKDFVREIKNIGGARWDPKSKAWGVSVASLPTVREILMDIYGETDISGEQAMHDVEVTALERIESICGPVQVMGKTLARAYHRDSGARPGPDVDLIEGNIRSDGSLSRWKSVVEKGAVFRLYNVPEYLVEKERRNAACLKITILK